MNKKKTIKVVSSIAIATSAFVSANTLEAAPSVTSTVENAKIQMKNLSSVYTKPFTSKKGFTNISIPYNKVVTAYKNAKLAVQKSTVATKTKSKYIADLDTTYKTYVTQRAALYVTAYNNLVKLDNARRTVADAFKKQDWIAVSNAVPELKNQLTPTLLNTYKKVYEPTIRQAFVTRFDEGNTTLKAAVTELGKVKIPTISDFNVSQENGITINMKAKVVNATKATVNLYDESNKLLMTKYVDVQNQEISASFTDISAGAYKVSVVIDALKSEKTITVTPIVVDINNVAASQVTGTTNMNVTAQITNAKKATVTVYNSSNTIVETREVSVTDNNVSTTFTNVASGTYKVVVTSGTIKDDTTVTITPLTVAISNVTATQITGTTNINVTAQVANIAKVTVNLYNSSNTLVETKEVNVISNSATTTFTNVAAGTYKIVVTSGDMQNSANCEVKPLIVPVAIENIAAINSTSVNITGSGLSRVTASSLSIVGNAVTSVTPTSDGKSAMVTFSTAVAPGIQQTLIWTDPLDTTKKIVTPFTYTLSTITQVTNLTTKLNNNATMDQYLQFSINGEVLPADVNYLRANGWNVKFQSTLTISDDMIGRVIPANIAGKLTLSYTVILTKGTTTIVSPETKVAITNAATAIKTITGAKLYTGNNSYTGVEVKSKTIVVGETLALDNVSITYEDGHEATLPASSLGGNISIASSDGTKFSVSGTSITGNSVGSAFLTLQSGTVTYTVPLTIATNERVAESATVDVPSLKIQPNTVPKSIKATVKDQYGDCFMGAVYVSPVKTVDGSKTIATTTIGTTNKLGEVMVIVTPSTNIGSGNLVLTNSNVNGRVLASVDVSSALAGAVANRILELKNPSVDKLVLDLSATADAYTNLYYNSYDANGYFVGAETSSTLAALGGGIYTVTSSDPEVASVANNGTPSSIAGDGTIQISRGTKVGTTTIKVLEGTLTRASIVITSVDSAPKITGVRFEPTPPLTNVGNFGLSTVLKSSGITIDRTDKGPLLLAGDRIFIDVAGGTPNKWDTTDIQLGAVSVIANSLITNNGSVIIPTILSASTPGLNVGDGLIGKTTAVPTNFTSGDRGYIIVKVAPRGNIQPYLTTLTVNIP